MKVENPADFKNCDVNGSAFEKPNTRRNENEEIDNTQNIDSGKVPPPVLPTRGILKRAKLANSKNESKKGI